MTTKKIFSKKKNITKNQGYCYKCERDIDYNKVNMYLPNKTRLVINYLLFTKKYYLERKKCFVEKIVYRLKWKKYFLYANILTLLLEICFSNKKA